jgi:hypothetical protein
LKISLTVTGLSQLQDLFNQFEGNKYEIIQNVMLESTNENIIPVAKSLAPKRTGALSESIEAQASEDDPLVVELIAGKPYARFMEYGERPHDIVPVSAKVLAFKVNGQTVFATKVHHPGIPEGKFSFLRPAIEEGMPKVAQDIATAIIEEFQQ